jgi:ammonia channel protein AmtB
VVWSFTVTFVIVKVLDRVFPGGIRVSAENEELGLDLSQHAEVGYSLDRV